MWFVSCAQKQSPWKLRVFHGLQVGFRASGFKLKPWRARPELQGFCGVSSVGIVGNRSYIGCLMQHTFKASFHGREGLMIYFETLRLSEFK